jgi:Regulator of ribonuclease activity B
MYERGDDLTQARTVDFCFAFPERSQALAFAETVDDRNLEVCVSYYEERKMWQAIVKRHMMPAHDEITSFESTLTSRAEQVGGEGDGWGCMLVKKK